MRLKLSFQWPHLTCDIYSKWNLLFVLANLGKKWLSVKKKKKVYTLGTQQVYFDKNSGKTMYCNQEVLTNISFPQSLLNSKILQNQSLLNSKILQILKLISH